MQKIIPIDDKAYLNGFTKSNGNYLWGGAMTLAFHQLIESIVKEPLSVSTSNPVALQIIKNYNESEFKKDCLSDEFYLAKAGFGPRVIREINK